MSKRPCNRCGGEIGRFSRCIYWCNGVSFTENSFEESSGIELCIPCWRLVSKCLRKQEASKKEKQS
jgi:hypothetical protein